jgi:hypothetical protein
MREWQEIERRARREAGTREAVEAYTRHAMYAEALLKDAHDVRPVGEEEATALYMGNVAEAQAYATLALAAATRAGLHPGD